MVKVLCRGGPAFWIKEPFTPEEQAYEDAIKRGERPAAPEGYDEDWMLMDNEVWPLTEAEEADFWGRLRRDQTHRFLWRRAASA